MGKRGPKPKPTALRKLEGTRRQSPVNPAEPEYEAVVPDCPDVLDEVAAGIWNRLAAPMAAQGLLTTADIETLTVYCQSFSRWIEAEEGVSKLGLVVKTPKGVFQMNPYVNASKTYLTAMNKAGAELGLTPASRVRLMATAVGVKESASRQEEAAVDVMDALLTEVESDG